MQNPLEITFHDMTHNDKIENLILEKFEKVKQISSDVTKCHVVLEKLSKHHQSANTSCVRLDLKVPHIKDIIVSEKCSEDEASMTSTTIKVFKRGKTLLREEVARIRERSRAAKEGELEKIADDLEYMDENYDKFDEWLSKIIKKEKPKKEIIAYNLGIFQTPVSYTLYLMGSRVYDAEDSDWACNQNYFPADRYFDFPKKYAEGKEPEEMERVVVALAKRFAEKEKFKESFLAKAQGFAVGFDDGDLFTIHQAGNTENNEAL